jgi:[acyl-carrier-protein] S-malonyltransferase
LLAAQQAEQSNPLDIAKVVAVAGFSLGEITALVFAGALSFPDGLRLVKTRSEAMAACSGGSMCNVRGISRGTLERLCRDTGCSIANSICDPSEEDEGEEEALFVCGGSAEGIEGLVKRVKALRKEAKLLRVSGAFHTAQMKPATAKLREMVRSLPMILPTKYLIYSNVTGHPYRSVREMRQRLVEQICSPVEWYKTIRDLLDNEKIEAFIECGPMDQLSKMLAVISPSSRDNVINFDIGCGRVPV